MSTNCGIGYQRKDGKVRAVYCHWDGYPTGVGDTLIQNHDSPKEARRLVSLGDISVLAGTNGTLAPRGAYGREESKGGIITYNRWRKEGSPQHGRLYENEGGYHRENQYGGLEYLYLYRPGYGWFVAAIHSLTRSEEPVFVPLRGLLLDEGRAQAF